MEFKELPEIAQNAACNLLRDTHRESVDKNATAKVIRDAFIALYSEAENTGAYKSLDSAVKESTCGIFCKKYMQRGVHVGDVSISGRDGILDEPTIAAHSPIEIGSKRDIHMEPRKSSDFYVERLMDATEGLLVALNHYSYAEAMKILEWMKERLKEETYVRLVTPIAIKHDPGFPVRLPPKRKFIYAIPHVDRRPKLPGEKQG